MIYCNFILKRKNYICWGLHKFGECKVTHTNIQLANRLKEGTNKGAFDVHQHKIRVQGANSNATHTINEDERTEFTRHINMTFEVDPDIGYRLPIPTNTMQLFDECRGKYQA
jgi:hypothetical protein